MRVTYILYTLSFLKVFSFPIVDRMSYPKLRRSKLEIVFQEKNSIQSRRRVTWKSWERPCMQLIMWHPLIMYQENGKFTYLRLIRNILEIMLIKNTFWIISRNIRILK